MSTIIYQSESLIEAGVGDIITLVVSLKESKCIFISKGGSP